MLNIEDLTVDIAGAPVLRQLSVQLRSGAVYAVVGRNGAGKTTLLRTVMGFLPVRQGTMALGSVDLLSKPAYARAAMGIGYAPEDRVMFPSMTVMGNLRLPCEALGLRNDEIDRRVADAVQVVPQVADMLPRSAAALSGGQGKMAALARALMVSSRLLLVDEPFQGLAPALARQYAESLSRLFALRPELCVVITESNRALLDRVDCVTLTLERGEISAVSQELT